MEKESTCVYRKKRRSCIKQKNAAVLFVEYLDQATALNGQKDKVLGKGALNNQITSLIFLNIYSNRRFPIILSKKVSEHEQLIQAVEMIPLEVVVRNYAAGSFFQSV